VALIGAGQRNGFRGVIKVFIFNCLISGKLVIGFSSFLRQFPPVRQVIIINRGHRNSRQKWWGLPYDFFLFFCLSLGFLFLFLFSRPLVCFLLSSFSSCLFLSSLALRRLLLFLSFAYFFLFPCAKPKKPDSPALCRSSLSF
jgi:hypothetical protein